MYANIFWAFISSLGFGFLFNVRDKNLIFSAIGGGIGWYFYALINANFNSAISALFIASIAISIYAEICARILKNPVTVFLVCALIPLVPGGGMYYTVFEAVLGNVNKSLTTGIETLSQAGAIAIGIILVSTLSRLLNKIIAISKLKLNKGNKN